MLSSWAEGDLYLDLSAGVLSSYRTLTATGQAFFGGPGCDPATEVCPLAMRDPKDFLKDADSWDVGISIGADIRFGLMSLGYRFIPSAVSTSGTDVHKFLFGVSFF